MACSNDDHSFSYLWAPTIFVPRKFKDVIKKYSTGLLIKKEIEGVYITYPRNFFTRFVALIHVLEREFDQRLEGIDYFEDTINTHLASERAEEESLATLVGDYGFTQMYSFNAISNAEKFISIHKSPIQRKGENGFDIYLEKVNNMVAKVYGRSHEIFAGNYVKGQHLHEVDVSKETEIENIFTGVLSGKESSRQIVLHEKEAVPCDVILYTRCEKLLGGKLLVFYTDDPSIKDMSKDTLDSHKASHYIFNVSTKHFVVSCGRHVLSSGETINTTCSIDPMPCEEPFEMKISIHK